MARKNIRIGLDLGSSKVAVAAGVLGAENLPDIIGVGLAAHSGIRRGVVVDVEETISAVTAAVEEAEKMAGIRIDEATVSISGNHIETLPARGVIAVSRADGEIVEDDVERVLEAAKALSVPANREILHVVPRSFIVDNTSDIKDPVGMTGVRLEVDANLITAAAPQVKNLTKALLQADIDIDSLVFGILADARLLLTKRQKELGVVLVNIGAGTASYAIYEEGALLRAGVLPVGSGHITSDLAIGLRTTVEVAEEIKIRFGKAVAKLASDREMIDMSKIDPAETQVANEKYVCQIIEARLTEIFSLVREELAALGKDTLLPAGAVLTGGGSKMTGIVELAKECLSLPVQIGVPSQGSTGVVDHYEDPAFSTALGLMLWEAEFAPKASTISFVKGGFKTWLDATGKVKEFFKQFMP